MVCLPQMRGNLPCLTGKMQPPAPWTLHIAINHVVVCCVATYALPAYQLANQAANQPTNQPATFCATPTTTRTPSSHTLNHGHFLHAKLDPHTHFSTFCMSIRAPYHSVSADHSRHPPPPHPMSRIPTCHNACGAVLLSIGTHVQQPQFHSNCHLLPIGLVLGLFSEHCRVLGMLLRSGETVMFWADATRLATGPPTRLGGATTKQQGCQGRWWLYELIFSFPCGDAAATGGSWCWC
jgi:hypothetical protein